jgi:hypothetical protein
LAGDFQHPQAVLSASLEIDRRATFFIAGGTTDLPDPKPKEGGLGDHLVIKDEIIRIIF